MLNDIKGITLKGANFKETTNLTLFNKTDRSTSFSKSSLIFGRNGTGKSTLAKAFRNISENDIDTIEIAELTNYDDQVLQLKDSEKLNIHIFDEKFIDENVKLRSNGIHTVVMLGEKADITQQIDSAIIELNKIKKKKDNQDKVIQIYSNAQNVESPLFYSKKIIKILQDKAGWSARDRDIKKRVIKSQVNENTYKKFSRLQSNVAKESLKTKFQELLQKKLNAENGVSFISDKVPSIDRYDSYVSYNDDLLHSLLCMKIENPDLSVREQKLLNILQTDNEGSQHLEERLIFFEDKKSSECPYCFQPLSSNYKNDLSNSIKNVLNRELKEHQDNLTEMKLNTIELELSEFEDVQGYDVTTNLLKYINENINSINNVLEMKLSDPYTPIEFSITNIQKLVEKLNKRLEILEKNRKQYNDDLKNTNSLIKDLNKLNNDITYYEILDSVLTMQKQQKKMDVAREKLNELIELVNKNELLIHSLKAKRSDVKLAIDQMNDFLKYIFFSSTRLQIKYGDENEYNLLSRGELVSPKDISQGERNIIGLCYFFVSIMQDQDEEEAYKKDCLLIIDDPVSSFDMENKVGILSFLKYELNKFLCGSKNTRSIILTHDLTTYYDLIKMMEELINNCKKTQNYGKKLKFDKFQLINNNLDQFNVKSYQQYNQYLEIVYDFANGDTRNELVIGNVMRQVLEAFSTFEYMKSIEDVSTDKDILSLLPDEASRKYFSNLMYRLVLHGGSHKEEAVQTMKDFNFFTMISSEEKRRTAKDILCFIYLLNQKHFLFHFEKIKSSKKDEVKLTLKTWCQDITG